MVQRLLTLLTDRIYVMPVLVLMPHSSCNCRCIMCDIWKANQNKKELSVEELQRHVSDFKKLKVREVTLSGGEALMHNNFWNFCSVLKANGMKVTLLSTGLLLSRNASLVAEHIDEVIVSLDGSREVHNKIRNVPQAFEKLEEGVKALKATRSAYVVKARCVLQKMNYRDFFNMIQTGKALGLDQMSFLAADVSSEAFNRPGGWGEERVSEVALTKEEVTEFKSILTHSFQEFRNEYESKFIAEGPVKMMTIAGHYASLLGIETFAHKKCNAPWVSAVVEADGEIRPCFFHPSYGNIRESGFLDTINAPHAIAFRKKLNVNQDPVCEKCVCSLHLGIMPRV